MINIFFNNGENIICTKYHKFYIKEIEVPISAKDLIIGQTL